MTQPPIRVVIVENHQLVSESLGLLLDAQSGIEVAGQAPSVADAINLPAQLAPDVVVIDFHLDDGTGREAAIGMRNIFPKARYVFLSRDGSDDAMLAGVEAGASAYLLKSTPAADVIAAIRAVAGGASLIPPEAIARLVRSGEDRDDKRHSLSPREREVLQLLSEGVPPRQIAHRLGIGYSTVRTHVRSIGAKLGARSILNAVVVARELGLVSEIRRESTS